MEATKFTEVGYVGRDVESIIRDLMENAVRMVRNEFSRTGGSPCVRPGGGPPGLAAGRTRPKKNSSAIRFEILLGRQERAGTSSRRSRTSWPLRREDVLAQLRSGAAGGPGNLEIEVEDTLPQLEVGGNSINIGDMMGGMMPKKTKIRRVKVKEARRILLEEESDKLIDEDEVREEAIRRAEQQGIVFIDEIDKVAGRSSGGHGPDVSRRGRAARYPAHRGGLAPSTPSTAR